MNGKWKTAALRALCGFFLLGMALVAPVMPAGAKNIVIVLDPGHGGTETGATRTWNGKNYQEEILNQKIANYAKKELETYEGVDVYLTRSSVAVPSMDRSTRVNIAKARNATALVSIHLNSTAEEQQTQLTGAYAYVPSQVKYPDSNPAAKNARQLGQTIINQLNADLGIAANGQMNNDELGIILFGMEAKIPSMIIEHCFVNNPNDCKRYLNTAGQLRRMGAADATAIAKYYHLVKKGSAPATAGWQTDEEGNRTYFDEYGILARNEWKEINGKYYYFNESGVLQTGVFTVGSKMFLTNKNGVRQKGFCVYRKRQYYANANGRLYIGWKTYEGKRYYFSPKTGGAYLGYKKIGSDRYFFDRATGEMLTGWQAVDENRTYYFDPVSGALQKNCWIEVKGKHYYLAGNGKPYANVSKVIGGVRYRFNAKGVCKNYR